MRVLLLDGFPADGPHGAFARAAIDAVAARATARGATLDVRAVRDLTVSWCQGCFECWTTTPGTCRIPDDGRALADAWVASDVAILLTPVVFGTYGADAKQVIDRLIGTLLPFFRTIDGETHHWPRYPQPPVLGVLGAVEDGGHGPAHAREAARTLATLVARHALNFAAPAHAAACLVPDAPVADVAAASAVLADTLLDARAASGAGGAPERADVALRDLPTHVPRDGDAPTRALLLVGSAKPRGTSTSEVLGGALLDALATRGVAGTVRWVQRDAHSAAGLAALAADARAHDLLVVATPLYVDTLPALVTRALTAIADDRARDAHAHDSPPPLAVAAIVNCGFPEARHAAVAAAVTALFARRARARWAGALTLGGGGAIAGRPLAAVGGMARHLAEALDAAGGALAEGLALPEPVREAVARPLMPAGLYRLAGDAGWLWTAAHAHALTRLWRRPALEAARDAAPEPR